MKSIDEPMWEMVERLTKNIPQEEWDKVPRDGSVNYRYYNHIAPKTQEIIHNSDIPPTYLPKFAEPKWSQIRVGDKKLKACLVDISGEEYELCDRASNNMWANEKKGHYGEGIANLTSDPRKVERIGKLGEMAFGKIFLLPVDFKYRKFGDTYDFIVFGNITIDVKTAIRPLHSNSKGLILAVNENNYEIPLNSELYIFAYLDHESRENKEATIALVGGKIRNGVKEYKREFGKGMHQNYSIPYHELVPIEKILNRYKDRLDEESEYLDEQFNTTWNPNKFEGNP